MNDYGYVPKKNPHLIYKSSDPRIPPVISRVLGHIKTLISNPPPKSRTPKVSLLLGRFSQLYSYSQFMRGLKRHWKKLRKVSSHLSLAKYYIVQ